MEADEIKEIFKSKNSFQLKCVGLGKGWKLIRILKIEPRKQTINGKGRCLVETLEQGPFYGRMTWYAYSQLERYVSPRKRSLVKRKRTRTPQQTTAKRTRRKPKRIRN